MWEINLNGQIKTFLLSLVIGVAFCILFDILNIIEEKLYFSKAAVFVTDILLFTGFAFFEFCFFLATENGEIRAFVFVGEIIGFYLCKKTLAVIYVPLILLIIKVTKLMFYRLYCLLIRPFLKFFSKISKKILKIVQKRPKFIKKA